MLGQIRYTYGTRWCLVVGPAAGKMRRFSSVGLCNYLAGMIRLICALYPLGSLQSLCVRAFVIWPTCKNDWCDWCTTFCPLIFGWCNCLHICVEDYSFNFARVKLIIFCYIVRRIHTTPYYIVNEIWNEWARPIMQSCEYQPFYRSNSQLTYFYSSDCMLVVNLPRAAIYALWLAKRYFVSGSTT